MLASATTNAPVARPRTRVLRARTASSGVARRARVGVARASTSRDDERDDERASANARATTSARRREMTLASLALAMAAAASATTPNAARAASDAGDWSSPGLASSGPAAKYVKTPSGLVYEDVNEGASVNPRARVTWRCLNTSCAARMDISSTAPSTAASGAETATRSRQS